MFFSIRSPSINHFSNASFIPLWNENEAENTCILINKLKELNVRNILSRKMILDGSNRECAKLLQLKVWHTLQSITSFTTKDLRLPFGKCGI